ncbi:MAG: hypothetical protein AB7D37_03585 [Desulfovibrio sp.]
MRLGVFCAAFWATQGDAGNKTFPAQTKTGHPSQVPHTSFPTRPEMLSVAIFYLESGEDGAAPVPLSPLAMPGEMDEMMVPSALEGKV